VGGGDWSRDRLVPDLVRAFLQGEKLVLRHPTAVRPWQHVLDALGGYLLLAQRLWETPQLAGPWNFAPDPAEACSVADLVTRLAARWGWDGGWTEDFRNLPYETPALQIDAAKARRELGWTPSFTLDETLDSVAEWYRAQAGGSAARALIDADLGRYHQLAAV
jgi:CDP-glucose 4,6-dehydratase